MHGLMPNYFKTVVPGFTIEHHSWHDQNRGWFPYLLGHPKASGLDFGELLYTPRGSQSLGTTGFLDDKFKLKTLYDQEDIDNLKYGPLMMKVNFESELSLRTYFIRILYALEGCPGLIMTGRTGRRIPKASTITSLPMFAKYARIRIDDLPMERLLVKLKDPFNREQIKLLKDLLTNSLDNSGLKEQYEIWSYADEIDTSKNVSA